jgi:hypothetical protein
MSAATQSKQELNNPDQDLNTSSNGATPEVAPVEQKQILSELGAKALKLMKVVTSFDPTAVIKELHVSFGILKDEMRSSYLNAEPGSAEQKAIASHITNAKDLFVNDQVLAKSEESVNVLIDKLADRSDLIEEQRKKIEAIVPNAIKEEVDRRNALIKEQHESDPFDAAVDTMLLTTSIADLNQRILDLENGDYDEALKSTIKAEEATLNNLSKMQASEERALHTAQKTLNGLLAERNPDQLSQEEHGKILAAVANTKSPRLVNVLVGGAIEPEAASACLDILNDALSSVVQERKIELVSNIEDSFESGEIKNASVFLGKAVNLLRRAGQSVAQISNLELPAIIAPKFLPAIGHNVSQTPLTATDAVERIAAIAHADPIAAEEVLHELSKQNIENLKDSIRQAPDSESAIQLTDMLKSAIEDKPVSRTSKFESLKEQLNLTETDFDAAEQEVFDIGYEKSEIELALTYVVADEIDAWFQILIDLTEERDCLVEVTDLENPDISQVERLNKDIQFCELYINELNEGKHDAALSAELYASLETANEMLSAKIDAAQEIAEKHSRLEASLDALESASIESLRVDVIAKARAMFERLEKQIEEGGPDSISAVVNIAKNDLNESYNQLLANAADALTAGHLSSAQRIIKSALKLQERFPEAVGEQIIEVRSTPKLGEDLDKDEATIEAPKGNVDSAPPVDGDLEEGAVTDEVVGGPTEVIVEEVVAPTEPEPEPEPEPLSSPLETDVKATVAPASKGAEEVSAPLEEEPVVKKRGFFGSWFDKITGNGSEEPPVESPEKM